MAESQDRITDLADTGRAQAFSDGVFAIVITLLVLDLRPPEGKPGQLLYGLLQQWPIYLAYLTSYVYVAVVWTNHKSAFRRIRFIDRGLHWANFGVLFTTALLPFPTAVVAKAMQHGNAVDIRVAVAFYAFIGAQLCLSWWVFFHYLHHHPELIKEVVEDEYFAFERKRALLGVVLYIAAGVIGYLVFPLMAMGIFLFLPVFYGITSEGWLTMTHRKSNQDAKPAKH
ncbi:MAG: putative integral rane protein [Pedosphaera sp.]|nr:putative integral rane protein [Pedosphaera sp.]